jgi:hypothetical protein
LGWLSSSSSTLEICTVRTPLGIFGREIHANFVATHANSRSLILAQCDWQASQPARD